jgi:predicted MFS family arabinose efflux permease
MLVGSALTLVSATAFGHYTFVASAGQALGPALIVLFGGSAPIPDTGRIFVWAVGLTALLVLISVTVRGPAAKTHRRTAGYGTFRDLLRQRGLVRALTTSSVVLAAVDISLVYLPALGAERDIASGTIGVLLAARAVASMTSRLFLGRLVDWMGRPRALTSSVALSAVTMALLPLPVPLWLLVCFVVAMGLGLGVGQPVTMSWVAEASPPGMRGRAMSLRLTGNRLGQVLVPSLTGLFAVGAGAAGVLWLTAGALAGVGVLSRGLAPPRGPD